LIIVIKRL